MTNTAAPKPLAGLDKREQRFRLVVEKQDMKKTVAEFLG